MSDTNSVPQREEKSTETSESYQKAKRYLIFASGILFLVATVGTFDGDTTLAGVKIAKPEHVGWVISAGVLYYFVQLNLFWSTQVSTARASLHLNADHYISNSISLISIGYFAYFAPEESNLGLRINGFIWFGLAVLLVFTSPAISKLLNVASKAAADAEENLFAELTGNQWTLVFAPKAYRETAFAHGAKKIDFRTDGSIGKGQNHNEYSWKITNGILEIFGDDGRIFSRFKRQAPNLYQSTDDKDLRSIKGQYIQREILP